MENILLDSQGHIRLGDFGECRAITSLDPSEVFCGTPEYLAPEVLYSFYNVIDHHFNVQIALTFYRFCAKPTTGLQWTGGA